MSNLDEVYKFSRNISIPEMEAETLCKLVGPSPFTYNYPRMKVGIEIEVEGILNSETLSTKNGRKFWKPIEDHSLRNNGAEFISNGPLVSKYIPYALQDFKRCILDNNKYVFSDRTSVHVHVDMRKTSIASIISNIILYTCLEHVMFKLIANHGIDRSSNIFCVSLNDSGMVHDFRRLVSRWKEDAPEPDLWDSLCNLVNNWNKYSALNIIPLLDSTKGTIEYRQMHGTDDLEFVNDWINMLLMLKAYCSRKTVATISTNLLSLNNNSRYEQFIKDIFGDDYYYKYFVRLDLQKLMEYPIEEIKSTMLIGVDNSVDPFEVYGHEYSPHLKINKEKK